MIRPWANDMLGFLRDAPAARSPLSGDNLSGDFFSGDVLRLAFVLLSNRGMDASMRAVKSVILLGLLAMMDSERVRDRLATVLAVKYEFDEVDTAGSVVVEANDTRRNNGSD